MSQGHSPLSQFEVKALTDLPSVPFMGYQLDLNFTNASLFMVLAVAAITLFLTLSMKGRALVPGRWQSLAEMTYELVAGMIKDNVGAEGRRYFPFIFSLFMFITFCNLLGMIPGGFTVTSHIAVTFALALVVIVGVTIIGFANHGLGYLGIFLPKGTPWWVAPLMIFIEIFSYFARPISLSLRLAANMMAGHTMMKVMAGFVVALGWLLGWAPLGFLVVLTGFEIFVALLQAYVFTILTCVYLNDAIHMH